MQKFKSQTNCHVFIALTSFMQYRINKCPNGHTLPANKYNKEGGLQSITHSQNILAPLSPMLVDQGLQNIKHQPLSVYPS